VSLVGLVGVHRHVMQALRNLRLDIVIITVCSPTRKRRTKTAALSFMAVSIKVFIPISPTYIANSGNVSL
jgi:hypothetical protein